MQCTDIPEFWKYFNTIINTGMPSEVGLVNMNMYSAVMQGAPDLNMTYNEFWEASQYVLGRVNKRVVEEVKKRMGKINASSKNRS
jgi:hypothetical protein